MPDTKGMEQCMSLSIIIAKVLNCIGWASLQQNTLVAFLSSVFWKFLDAVVDLILFCFLFQVGSSTWCMHFLTLANASKQVKEDYSQALQVELILMFITTVMLWLTKSSPIVHCIFNIPLLYFTDCCCAFMASTKVCWQVFSSHERHDEFYVCQKSLDSLSFSLFWENSGKPFRCLGWS